MDDQNPKIAFGPIPSRRLGQSLGINNIPHKICTYSCVYCQVGLTNQMVNQRAVFYSPKTVVEEVTQHAHTVLSKGKSIDYLSFVPDGEPTLDINLGVEIDQLKPQHIPIAIITNASLIHDSDVRRDLRKADWVSIKIDAAMPKIWKKVNRPQKTIDFKNMLKAMPMFSDEYKGVLTTETMLVKDLNDSMEHINSLIEVIHEVNPKTCYLSAPIRPPAIQGILPSTEQTFAIAFDMFKDAGLSVELNTSYGSGAFDGQDDIKESLLRILAVHPMNKSEIQQFLHDGNHDWAVIEELQQDQKILAVEYQNKTYYVRKHTR